MKTAKDLQMGKSNSGNGAKGGRLDEEEKEQETGENGGLDEIGKKMNKWTNKVAPQPAGKVMS
jgi:hypothetical protein